MYDTAVDSPIVVDASILNSCNSLEEFFDKGWWSYIVYPSGIFDPDVEYVAVLSNT